MYIPNFLVELIGISGIIPSIGHVYPSISSFSEVTSQRPVVLWHGLGDSYNSSSMNRAKDTIGDVYPELFIHSIYVNPDDSKDQSASLWGKVYDQIDFVCAELKEIPELENGFDAIGFSQGGLFLRAAIEICGLPINNLITFGSPHLGISELPLCAPTDWVCEGRNKLLRSQVWKDSVQDTVVPAQYFRDPKEYDSYLEYSHFLADINNERTETNMSYSENLSKVNQFAMVLFTEDATVVPKESAWFGDYDAINDKHLGYTETRLYKEDLIGLKELDERNSLQFLTIDNRHMAIPQEFLEDITRKYLGGFIGKDII